ncbi:CsbD family protein [Noviherbaspirillum denitrificans]|uniref:General stress protein CsbD n=1 Tax=Noviherbaspirillum denitrificans TaxID=1968433 RepID=A0A254T6L2_9BURK|nr:CsbD family protein [Noviherbaspirillum denitrificans]OWW18291.1 general stress protein CsbD [Noviherbaspirillum denitrificans]
MNRDQIRGGIKDAAGRIQRKFGQLIGSNQQEAKGVATQAEGKFQRTVGNASDTVEKTTDNAKDVLKR